MEPGAAQADGQTTLHVEGMTCGACVARVDRALRGVKGVREAAVNLTTGMARVSGQVDQGELVRAVERAGYTGRVLEGDASTALREVREAGEEHEKQTRRRLIYGALFGIPAIVGEMMLHQWQFAGQLFGGRGGLDLLVALLATLVMIFTGWPFFRGAWRALSHRSANMDVLVALGAGTAWVASVISLIVYFAMQGAHRPSEHGGPAISEFHAAVMIVVLVTLGKYLEARARRVAAAAVGGLAVETRGTATRVREDGSTEVIAADNVAEGDRIQVVAHERVAVDGEVIEGSGSADLSVVTGESVPVEVAVGTRLPGGATLADGRVVMRATSTASASTVARIWELVNAAQASKTEIQGLADRVAGVFVPVVVLVAWGNFILWMVGTGDWRRALVTTIATIVIACPCAMGLATPTAITVALGAAAKRGILFTRARALEGAGKIGTVVFDKTGTLTEGKPRVSTSLVARDLKVEGLLRMAASAEQFSEHPLAKAIVAAAEQQKIRLFEPVEFASLPGGGVRARFEAPAPTELAVGSLPYVQSLGVHEDLGPLGLLMMGQGETIVAVADVERKELMGLIGLRDMVRPEGAEAIEKLAKEGIRVVVLSGDTEQAVRGALHGLKIDEMRARVGPAEKAAAIEELKKETRNGWGVAFVGDGVNDGPALAAADLGIAMASGTDLARAAGDVLLVGNRLTAVPEVIELSRRTLRVIKQNLFWAFAYNVAAIPLAMLGILPPGVAAGAMMVSSLTVVGNALRLRKGGR